MASDPIVARACLAAAIMLALGAPVLAQSPVGPSQTFNWSAPGAASGTSQVVVQALQKGLDLIAGISVGLLLVYSTLLGLESMTGKLSSQEIVNFVVGAMFVLGANLVAKIIQVIFAALQNLSPGVAAILP